MEMIPTMPQMPYAVQGASDMSIQDMLRCVNYYDKELTAEITKNRSFLSRILPSAMDKTVKEFQANITKINCEKCLKACAMGGDIQLSIFAEWGNYQLAQAKAQYRSEAAMRIMSIYQNVIVPICETRDVLFQRLQLDFERCEKLNNPFLRKAAEQSIQNTTLQIVDLWRRLGEYLASILDEGIQTPAPLHP